MTTHGFTLFDTAVGTCAVAWGEAGLRRVWLPERNESALRRRVAGEGAPLQETTPPPLVERAINQMRRHVAGEHQSFGNVPVDLGETTVFRRAIYAALRRTRPGETLSYAELASRAGRPNAARAVGQAMAKNPVPLIVPCHRVLSAGGAIGGFSASGGARTKVALLAREGAPLPGSPPFDTKEAVSHLRRDRRLGKLIDRVGPLTLTLRPRVSTYASLARAIVYQQLSGRAAATIHKRLVALHGHRVLRPEDVAKTSDEDLRGAGLSRPKLASLRDLTARALAAELPSRRALDRMEDEAIVEALTPIRGIGRWTVEMLLIFQLGRPNVLPTTDLGIQNGFAIAFGTKRPPPADVLVRGDRWAPFRTAASWYLWRANEL